MMMDMIIIMKFMSYQNFYHKRQISKIAKFFAIEISKNYSVSFLFNLQIACICIHTCILIYSSLSIRGELVDSVSKRPEQLFGVLHTIMGVISTIAFCHTFFQKDKTNVLRNVQGSSFCKINGKVCKFRC